MDIRFLVLSVLALGGAALGASAAPMTRQEVIDQIMVPYTGPIEKDVDTSTLKGKVMAGYQGWHAAEGDGLGRGWYHLRGPLGTFAPGSCTIDLWPDVSELDPDELYPTAFKMADGTTAMMYSDYNLKTVVRHFKWMKDYGIDGVFVQRFAGEVMGGGFQQFTKVLANCREGANTYGRTYAVMYDLSGMRSDQVPNLLDDWKLLVDKMQITRDPAYLYQDGKPVVTIWGVGFNDGRQYNLGDIKKIIDFLKNDPKYGGNTVMLGIPTYWREQKNDTITDPAFLDVCRSADILSPWTVGRYGTPEAAASYTDTVEKADVEWCAKEKKFYLPVVFPGFSWSNMHGGKTPLDQIPRLKGKFLWAQYAGAVRNGATAVYESMFDEMDEGTAIFKCTNNPPVGDSKFVTFEGLPSDFYLRLVGYATKMVRGDIKYSDVIPSNETLGVPDH